MSYHPRTSQSNHFLIIKVASVQKVHLLLAEILNVVVSGSVD